MTRPIAVLRPQPGNAATVARIGGAGRSALALPLFEIRPLDWTPPDPAGFDALILTSANAVRHAGPGLARLAVLPVLAVGDATASAARDAGLTVRAVGDGDAAALADLAVTHGITRALHLAGADHRDLPPTVVARTLPVYASVPRDADLSALTGAIALVHSPAAAERLAMLVDAQQLDRAGIAVAVISAAAAAACGGGWAALAVAARPREDALLAAALALDD
ncbi:uroporphyrinogen-III synthase [Sphingomonas sp. FW199]|uniref:uroporphyrinogen-III synthase n=1 Tax=Sphingomonas sp. FW199 TaxID=3400217 RepID=UPI003CE883A4